MYEHGLNYYREHNKRIKRKKTMAASSPIYNNTNYNSSMLIDYSPSTPIPLGIHGWMTRYDYKLATFAEFRQELDTALKY